MEKAVVDVNRSLPVWKGLAGGVADEGVEAVSVEESCSDGVIWATRLYNPFSDRKSYDDGWIFVLAMSKGLLSGPTRLGRRLTGIPLLQLKPAPATTTTFLLLTISTHTLSKRILSFPLSCS